MCRGFICWSSEKLAVNFLSAVVLAAISVREEVTALPWFESARAFVLQSSMRAVLQAEDFYAPEGGV
jgi:hypothetical protein